LDSDIDKHVLRRYEVLQKLGKGVREEKKTKTKSKKSFFFLGKKDEGGNWLIAFRGGRPMALCGKRLTRRRARPSR
jgi:hypothetical protein